MTGSLPRWQAIILGLLVTFGLGLGGVGLFAVGSRQLLWADVLHLRAGFRDVRGVEIGTRVRVQGIEAGEVVAVEPPAKPGENVHLRLRVDGRLRSLIRADACVQIMGEGMIGGKVVIIDPGTAAAEPATENALLASRQAAELADVLAQVQQTLQGVSAGQGSLQKLLHENTAHDALLQTARQGEEALRSFQRTTEAVQRVPVLRNYVEDPFKLLHRPNMERNRRWFAEEDLFEPGRAILTGPGKQKLDEIAPWLTGLRHKGSEVVVAAYSDPKVYSLVPAQNLTRHQSEAVSDYLVKQHGANKMGLLSSRKVTPLGCGIEPPPVPESETLPPARVEVLVFVPQG